MAKKKEEKELKQNPEEAVDEASEMVEELKQPSELEKAQALAEDYKRKWYAVSAEYDNYRKRNQAAVSKAYQDGAAEAVLKLLPVADNFGYALDGASDEKTKAGIEKVIKSFNTLLGSLGVEEIPVNIGDKFDESVMEAVLDFPCEEGEEQNTVKQILKKGYKAGDKVIRYAQVAVTI
ncbi:MAG: nucleotide exchange factor GrpE [Clostridia bacterium]|nr:nucleotide exchange factor GrpE [Clostridia bacterium]